MATDTRCEPKTLLTTVGIVEKKPPFAAPLTMTKNASGARPVETGQMANMLTALTSRHMSRVLSAPSLSQSRPHKTRPTAEEKLKPASRPAPVDDDSPTDWLYSGRKKGGTSSGNVATAPATNTTRKPGSLKRRLWGWGSTT